jgi:phospholipid/cholesterol/gamma-HCH transport system substrate-binding protein
VIGRRRNWSRCVVVALTALIVAGCAVDPGTFTSSVRSGGGDRTLTIRFADALNLPTGTDVTLNGLRIGSVSSVRLHRSRVDIVAKVRENSRITTDAAASIRQDTVLGDPYVAILSSVSAPLLEGDTIELERTASAPPLEDTLSVVANFVNAGSIQDIEKVMRSANTALPHRKQTTRVARIASIDLRSLAADTRRIDQMLDGLDATAGTVNRWLPSLSQALAPKGMHWWSQLSNASGGIGVLLPSIGSVFEGGMWLMPMLTRLNGSADVMVEWVHAVARNDDQIRKFVVDNFFPFVQSPRMNIVTATAAEGQEMIGTITRLLRMLGAVR